MKLRSVVLFTYTSLVFMASVAFANVVLIGNNVTVSFNDIQANFAPRVKGSGECGVLYLAEPLNACSSLKARSGLGDDVGYPPFVLIIRGGCSFEDKVKRAQSAGYRAAVVYDNEENGALIANPVRTPSQLTARSRVTPEVRLQQAMSTFNRPFDDTSTKVAGNSAGIKIHAVFISKEAGQVLKSYTGLPNMELWLIPGFENSAWSIMAVSFISLLAMSAILATCFFVRRHRIRRERPRGSHAPGFHRMSSGLVRALPSHIFMAASEGDCTSSTCAICLEDYIVGEKLRILPCRHKFHALCVDCWLTAWRSFCPVCKRDARASMSDPPASESTPLLSPNPTSTPSIRLSPPIQIVRGQAHSCPIPRIPFSGQPCLHQHHLGSFASPYHSLGNSPVSLSPGTGHGPAGVRHLSPLCPSAGNSRYMSVYVPNPNGWSRSPAGRPWPLHYSGSAASFLAFTSAGSLPEC